MAAIASAAVRQALRLVGYVLLTLLVYWLNAVTPSTARFGILYTIPVLLVTWTEGLAWGIVFAAATTVFREAIAWVEMPADTPTLWRILNGLAYLAVLGLAIAGLRNVFKGTPNVTASIGVVACTATDASTDDLLRRADQAMYDAKKSGKDRVVQVAL